MAAISSVFGTKAPTVGDRERRSRQHYGRAVQLAVEQLIVDILSIDPMRLYLSARGSRDIMFARHVAMYLVVVEGGLSHTTCGRLFERDRRTVAYAVARIEQRRDDNPQFDRTLDLLARQLDDDLVRRLTDTNDPHSAPSHT